MCKTVVGRLYLFKLFRGTTAFVQQAHLNFREVWFALTLAMPVAEISFVVCKLSFLLAFVCFLVLFLFVLQGERKHLRGLW